MLLINKAMAPIFVGALISLVCACGSGTTEELNERGVIGTKIDASSALVTQSGLKSDTFFVYEKEMNYIQKFNLNTMTHEWYFASEGEAGEAHGVLGHPDGNYVIDITTKSLAIYNAGGMVVKNPFAFQGTPVSAAFNPQSGYLVVYDSLQSVGILRVNADGSVAGSALLGPLLAADKQINAGDIDDSGNLILSMTDNSLLRVDLASTLEKGLWQYTEVANPGVELDWIAPNTALADHVLATSGNTLYLINYQTGAITDQMAGINFEKKSKQGESHVYAGNGTTWIYYAGTDGKLVSQTANNANFVPENSTFSVKDQVVILYDGKTQVLKYRLSDNLVIGSAEVKSGVKIDLGTDYFVAHYPSRLGLLEKRSYSSKEDKSVLKGYNFKILSNRN